MPVVRVKPKGNVRVPAEIRRALGLSDGDRLLVEVVGQTIVLTPLPPVESLDALRGRYAPNPLDEKDPSEANETASGAAPDEEDAPLE